MDIIRLASFSDGKTGGNPAGVCIGDSLPEPAEMQRIAAEVGYSETVFAMPCKDGWRARYFSPETEVPFCGHATIALGAALAKHSGAGVYRLYLSQSDITVEGFVEDGEYSAALQSPPTFSQPAEPAIVDIALALFGYSQKDLDKNIPPAFANAGAQHLIIALNSRRRLSEMAYELDAGRTFMLSNQLVTITFVFAESDRFFHTRNPFASGGVYEDPATGAASAALAGYLRDIDWPHQGRINIIQGEDMGSRSLISVVLTNEIGASVRVSGGVREL